MPTSRPIRGKLRVLTSAEYRHGCRRDEASPIVTQDVRTACEGDAAIWDPATYLRFGDERSRPFADLLARIGAQRPRAVVDLGCGPGTLIPMLAARWPEARIRGLDSSPEMVARAVDSGLPARFAVADVRDWRPEPEVDVVVCNAVLQWVPDHTDLLPGWVAALPAGAWLGLQVPGNTEAPSHRAIREVAAEPAWRDLVTATGPRPVPGPERYASLLMAAGCAVDAWETTYVHLLPADGGDHPVLRWLEGTALRPVHAALGDGAEWTAFRRALGDRLAQSYPVTAEGVVPFPFRRVFAVARTPGG
jgi:trans-aconitate 2-methyltransferase